ncbi:hypothetical protein [Anaerotignum propionicum]|uniref:TM2 domain protein n=1 Tax=Anaerotignum propionicum DSM 1682 TaxID=991789 RepID=A0ABM5Y7J9_ANAPI|nr:hypothetical protein [Anaerotignum propionicum]AMJ40037.1 hypothetical protein CPRO_04280 [Anaerotignum propionicum DSM 1682]
MEQEEQSTIEEQEQITEKEKRVSLLDTIAFFTGFGLCASHLCTGYGLRKGFFYGTELSPWRSGICQ